ncbi:MAG: hypothetical protein IJS12_04135 [Lachnospiraceae bacterium]|nr:hypothetical protein [Butyrivibrio sp.]MBQ9333504.1 hypothetical protein [Lachnospiraceae bacterium]
MRKYCYQQDLSVMDENANPISTLRSRIYIDAMNIGEDAVLETLEEYGKHFVGLIGRDVFLTKGDDDLNRLNDMLGSCGNGGVAL